jgi:hypothetical protein
MISLIAIIGFIFWLMFLYDAIIDSPSNQFPPLTSFLISCVFLIWWVLSLTVFPRRFEVSTKEVRFNDNSYVALLALLIKGPIKKIPLNNIRKFWVDKMWIWIITFDKKNYEINTRNFNRKELIQLAKIFRERKITVLDKSLREYSMT